MSTPPAAPRHEPVGVCLVRVARYGDGLLIQVRGTKDVLALPVEMLTTTRYPAEAGAAVTTFLTAFAASALVTDG